MCVVSMVTDHYIDKWRQYQQDTITTTPGISPQEVEEFRKLLERAREYDKRNNEPECELDSKRQALKKIAKELGVEIEFI